MPCSPIIRSQTPARKRELFLAEARRRLCGASGKSSFPASLEGFASFPRALNLACIVCVDRNLVARELVVSGQLYDGCELASWMSSAMRQGMGQSKSGTLLSPHISVPAPTRRLGQIVSILLVPINRGRRGRIFGKV